jgi:hypothetical protein
MKVHIKELLFFQWRCPQCDEDNESPVLLEDRSSVKTLRCANCGYQIKRKGGTWESSAPVDKSESARWRIVAKRRLDRMLKKWPQTVKNSLKTPQGQNKAASGKQASMTAPKASKALQRKGKLSKGD